MSPSFPIFIRQGQHVHSIWCGSLNCQWRNSIRLEHFDGNTTHGLYLILNMTLSLWILLRYSELLQLSLIKNFQDEKLF